MRGEGVYKCLALGSRAFQWNSWVTILPSSLFLFFFNSPPPLCCNNTPSTVQGWSHSERMNGGLCVFMLGRHSEEQQARGKKKPLFSLTLYWLLGCFSSWLGCYYIWQRRVTAALRKAKVCLAYTHLKVFFLFLLLWFHSKIHTPVFSDWNVYQVECTLFYFFLPHLDTLTTAELLSSF